MKEAAREGDNVQDQIQREEACEDCARVLDHKSRVPAGLGLLEDSIGRSLVKYGLKGYEEQLTYIVLLVVFFLNGATFDHIGGLRVLVHINGRTVRHLFLLEDLQPLDSVLNPRSGNRIQAAVLGRERVNGKSIIG